MICILLTKFAFAQETSHAITIRILPYASIGIVPSETSHMISSSSYQVQSNVKWMMDVESKGQYVQADGLSVVESGNNEWIKDPESGPFSIVNEENPHTNFNLKYDFSPDKFFDSGTYRMEVRLTFTAL